MPGFANPLPLNLRHVDLRAVLVEIGQHTGLRFRVPDRPYAGVKAPFFYSLANRDEVGPRQQLRRFPKLRQFFLQQRH